MNEEQIGCFGSILVFDRNQLCPPCPLFQRCGEQVQINKVLLAAELKRVPETNVVTKAVTKRAASRKNQMKTLLNPPTPAKVVFAPSAAAATLNKKPREKLDMWLKRFVDLDLLRTGVNPLRTGVPAKNDLIFMDVLLGMKVFTRVQFIDEWHTQRGVAGEQRWSDGTMSAQFLINSDILIAQGFLARTGDTFNFVEAQ